MTTSRELVMFSGRLVFPKSWSICHGPFSISVSPGMAATNTQKHSHALIDIEAWRSPNSLIGRVCGTSKCACTRKPPNFIIWAFEVKFYAPLLPTRINRMTGKFGCVRLTDASVTSESLVERKGSHHFHSEPCAGHREVPGEASVGACAGRAIEPRNAVYRMCRDCPNDRRQHFTAALG